MCNGGEYGENYIHCLSHWHGTYDWFIFMNADDCSMYEKEHELMSKGRYDS